MARIIVESMARQSAGNPRVCGFSYEAWDRDPGLLHRLYSETPSVCRRSLLEARAWLGVVGLSWISRDVAQSSGGRGHGIGTMMKRGNRAASSRRDVSFLEFFFRFLSRFPLQSSSSVHDDKQYFHVFCKFWVKNPLYSWISYDFRRYIIVQHCCEFSDKKTINKYVS